MATWKRLTGAVDSSAQTFLKNKKFSREKRKFSWDWHAWNLLLVSTPSLLLGMYLHRVEKRMHAEARVRDEIQESTGVSSRGFLIPQKKIRQEVQGMLSAGNQPKFMVDDEDADDGTGAAATKGVLSSEEQRAVDGTEGGIRRHLRRQVPRGGSPSGTASPDMAALQRRLDAIESVLEIKSGTSSAGADVDGGPGRAKGSMLRRKSDSDRGKGATEPGSFRATAARKNDAPDADAAPGTAIDKAIGMASTAGIWAIEAGERGGKRLLKFGREWLAGETRQDEARLEDAERREGDFEQHAARAVAGAADGREERMVASKEQDSSSGGSARIAREGSASGVGGTGSDTERDAEEAWRRGSLDGPDKR